MKKNLFAALSVFVLLSGCKHESVEPPVMQDGDGMIVLSGDEVHRLIIKEYGHDSLSFERKMRFLSDYIVTSLTGEKLRKSSSGRTQAYNSAMCVAGTWEQAQNDWTFMTDKGPLTEHVSASRTIRRPSPHTVGASASFYLCEDNYCYFQDIESVDPPQQVTCVESDVKAAARSWYWDGYHQLTSYITCDD